MKKIFAIAVSAVLLLGALSFAGCAHKDNPHGYDANIVVQSSRGDEWLFAPETEELTAEYEYTGEEIEFRVARYNLPDMWIPGKGSPQDFRNEWFDSGNDSRFYQDTYIFYNEVGKRQKCKRVDKLIASEKGKYVFGFKTSGEGIFNYREFYLTVTVQ